MSEVPNLLAPPADASAAEVSVMPLVAELPVPLAPGSYRDQQPAQEEAFDEVPVHMPPGSDRAQEEAVDQLPVLMAPDSYRAQQPAYEEAVEEVPNPLAPNFYDA